jgi:hypothetical protein
VSWILSRVLPAALLTISLASAHPDEKIDVNLASVSELQKLPGITEELARKIMSGRPYGKAEDLRTAGVSETVIQRITPLIKFSPVQQEKPGHQGGAVASIGLRGKAGLRDKPGHQSGTVSGVDERLYRCANAFGTEPKQAFMTAADKSEAAVCIPRAWFTQDGSALSETGKMEVSSLVEHLNTHSGNQVKIVELRPGQLSTGDRLSTTSSSELLAKELRGHRIAYTVDVIPAEPPSSARTFPGKTEPWGGLGGISSKHDNLKTVDLNKTASEVDTLVLVVPSSDN